MKTYATKAGDIQRTWYHVDASGQTLGRLASRIASILKGKHKAIYSPHMDVGDFVIVTNAAKVRVTGNKLLEKMYYRHSEYPGGLRSESLRDLLARRPERVIEHAVKGMLPHNALGHQMIQKLKVYGGPEHPHAAQQPTELPLEEKENE